MLDTIKYLCRRINREEWSGVIFFQPNGTIANPKEFSITLKNLFPMEKGSSTFTEYSFDDPEFIDFRMANMEVNFLKMGHIHSHNTMTTFFSHTDKEEVHDNSAHHNYYLSVIVNNYMEFDAEIGFRTKLQVINGQAMDEEGDSYSLPQEAVDIEEILIIYPCKVITEETLTVPEHIIKRTDQIIAIKEQKDKQKVVTYPKVYTGGEVAGFKGSNTPNRDKIIPPKSFKSPNGSANAFEEARTHFFANDNIEDEIDDVQAEFIKELTIKTLLLGKNFKNVETVEQALAITEKMYSKKPVTYIQEFMVKYPEIYQACLGRQTEIDPEEYLSDMEDVETELVDFDGTFSICPMIGDALEQMRYQTQLSFTQLNLT